MIGAALAVIITLLVVIGIHELGHALAAWIFKVRIKRVAIGFGKPVIQWKSKSGCEWVVGAVLLGGYVHLSNTRNASIPLEEQKYCFDKKPIRHRMVILLAGSMANLLVAWVALVSVYVSGLPYKIPQIAFVKPESIAATAGLLAKDQFISINNKKTRSWEEAGQALLLSWGKKTIPFMVKTAEGVIKNGMLDLTQESLLPSRSLLASLGINPNKNAPTLIFRSSSLWTAIQEGSQALVHWIYVYLTLLKQLLCGALPLSLLLGPVGLLVVSIQSFSEGLTIFTYFIAQLSLSVALLNLLPVPGLDGGSIGYALIEKIRRQPMSIAWELLLYRFMLIALFLLLVQLLKNDLLRFLQ